MQLEQEVRQLVRLGRLQIEAHAIGDDNERKMTLNETSTSLVQKALKGLVKIFDRSMICSGELN